ncbi:MAG TPA: histone [Hadesarchaea archaeon]|nr:histone [Hadesarchaea archaeon]
MPEFSIATMAKLIRKISQVRVSRGAALELSAVLEEHALKISSEALKLAQHRGGKTVNESDIRTAVAGARK